MTINRPVLFALITMSLAYCIALTQTVRADAMDAISHETLTFTVNNRPCAAGPITVRKAMSPAHGIARMDVYFKARTATATCDPARATPQDIAAASTGIGFPATLVDKDSSDE
jgi:mercuric ion binding protein